MKTFIFDYDDTLAANQYLFNNAIIDFQRYIQDKMKNRPPHPKIIVNTLDDIENKNIKIKGFEIKRFSESMVETFEKLSEQCNYTPTKEELNEVYIIGKKIHDLEKGLLDGAEDVLNFLKKEGDELILYTKGDKELQQRKIDLNNLERWFASSDIHIVGEKNGEYLEKIVGRRNKNETYKVGNSVRSDVYPAMHIGLKVIYIPCETWSYEEKDDLFTKSNPRIFRFESLIEIIEKYEELE